MALINTPNLGELNVQEYVWRWFANNNDPNSTFGYTLKTDKGNYTFIPDDVIQKGVLSGDKQYYFKQFLNKDTLNYIYQNGQPIDLAGFTDFSSGDALQKRLDQAGFGTTGILLPESWVQSNLGKASDYNVGKQVGNVSVGAIGGIGEKDGNLVYVPSASGASNASAYITSAASNDINTGWVEKKGGVLGSLARGLAGIPFLPEIAGVLTQNPYVYGALKGYQGGMSGEDPLKVLGSAALGGAAIGYGGAAGAEPAAAGGVDYSLAAGTDVGGLGLQIPTEALAPELGATVGAGGSSLLQPGLVIDPASLAPALGSSIGVGGVSVPPDYSLLGGADLTNVGETGVIPGSTGAGLQQPTVPDLGYMGGGQGMTVPVDGGTVGATGTTPTGATPAIGDPSSFINDPNVIGQDVIAQANPSSISVKDALDAARLANQLLASPQQPQVNQQGLLNSLQTQPGRVDYSTVIGLLTGGRATTPNVYQSLLGTRYG